MGKKTKFYLVAADALPEIFLKVAEAKRMLHAGEVSTAGEAARQVGISRSAFYKYRDSVQPFNDMKTGRIITFYALLKDNPGVLSNVLSIFAGSGANFLTDTPTTETYTSPATPSPHEARPIRDALQERFARKYTHHQPEHPDKRLRRRDHLGGDERYARIARGAHRQRRRDGGRGQVRDPCGLNPRGGYGIQ